MTQRDVLKREFEAEDGSFLLHVRCDLTWDEVAFRRLTSAMYDVADAVRGSPSIESWIAEGFWYCDTWLPDWTSHPNFPRPQDYDDRMRLIHDLAYFLFIGQSPYLDDTLARRAKG
jgi:hypothetical protein